ncbi:MAG: hypothetical protein [Microviridae sp.]|nr:MAG: hypothetical protein [Microviridae sp.]
MKLTVGGGRLGSGNRMTQELHGYGKSNHDIGYQFKTTMAPGVLVPFLTEIGLPGTDFDINLNANINTKPTLGPLFDGFKFQADIFQIPMRLYNGWLNNDKLDIGLQMEKVKFPLMTFIAPDFTQEEYENMVDIDNCHINPSCILKYIQISGFGISRGGDRARSFNALMLLCVWDAYKCYYANKQEKLGAVIHTDVQQPDEVVDDIFIDSINLPQFPAVQQQILTFGTSIQINSTALVNDADIILTTDTGIEYTVQQLFYMYNVTPTLQQGTYDAAGWGELTIVNWRYRAAGLSILPPKVQLFELANIDLMRERILQATGAAGAFEVMSQALEPYSYLVDVTGKFQSIQQALEGLPVKTYQSDMLQNWLNTETIVGSNGINEITAIDTSGGSFTIDALIMQKKVWEMLNRIALSGGSYQDYLAVTYLPQNHWRPTTPVYLGSLIKEVVFQEVVSQSAVDGEALGSLAGKGIMGQKHKGGRIHAKCDEPCIILGLCSLTPRINYSQGNAWFNHLKTMADLHVPAMDGIGYQDLITEQMAWWDTYQTNTDVWVQKSAGKQPAWTNYTTNVNRTYGNFAIKNSEMFMTLNRQYKATVASGKNVSIQDLTTYIEPSKYNNIFADAAIDAQNFWLMMNVDINVRRLMSARQMPVM